MWQHVTEAFLESFERAVVNAARILPGLLGLVLLVTVALVLALAVRASVGRVLARIEFDRRVHRWAIAGGDDWLPDASPTQLAASVGFWTVLLTGVAVALHAFEPTTPFGQRALGYLPQVVVAVALLGIGIVAGRYVQRAVLIGAVNLEIRAARALSVAVKWVVLTAAVALALEHLGVGGRVLPILFATLFGGAVLAAALAVGLGSRDLVSRSWERRGEARGGRAGQDVRHL